MTYMGNLAYECPYGKLYNWYAATDFRNVCPSGWRVPSDSDWENLINYLDPANDNLDNWSVLAGLKMRTVGSEYWNTVNPNTTNESGFSGLPGGEVAINGLSIPPGNYGRFWSSSSLSNDYAQMQALLDSYLNWHSAPKQHGLSIRCMRD
jgi:uncharacterized protein (TIGR02145 family)